MDNLYVAVEGTHDNTIYNLPVCKIKVGTGLEGGSDAMRYAGAPTCRWSSQVFVGSQLTGRCVHSRSSSSALTGRHMDKS